LHEAVNICNLFIEKNKLVVSTRGKVQEWNRDFKTLNKPVELELPIAVLINSSSASASEIVAGTLQDYDRGVVIGTRSFGKGLVQQTRDVAFNTRLKLTTAKYYTPSGRCIQAIDYTHRNEDGSVSKVPDSLMNEFTTANGRTVYDGGGVMPDIAIEPEKLSNIAISLLTRDLVFDFVTQYVADIDSIARPEDFTITNELFAAFTAYLQDKEYDYETRSELLLKQLEEQTKREMYYDAVSADMARIRANIGQDKANDLEKFREEIELLLEEEIIGRFYYQNGQIIASFDHDPVILEAIRVLKDTGRYQSILSGN
jgi:carboxyl-terminal processing protease